MYTVLVYVRTSSASRERSGCVEGRYPRRPADQLHSSSSVWCRNPWPSSSSGSQTNVVETIGAPENFTATHTHTHKGKKKEK